MNATIELSRADIDQAIIEYLSKHHNFMADGEVKYTQRQGCNFVLMGADVPVKVKPVKEKIESSDDSWNIKGAINERANRSE